MRPCSRARVVVAAAQLVALLIGGCSSSSSSAPEAVKESACSTGAAYAWDAPFPVLGTDGVTRATCTPRCAYGGARDGDAYYLDALPSGACSSEGSSCAMTVRVLCCGQTSPAGPVHAMRCACTAGSWSCGIAVQGAAVCACSPPGDASTDGSTDSAAP